MRREDATKRFRWIAAAAVIGLGVLLIDSSAGGLGGADSAGYANTARDILAGRIVVPIDALSRLGLDESWSWVFIPLAQVRGPRPDTMVPLYPPGFPLHLALSALVLGWKRGPFLVSPILAIAALILTYFLARELTLSRPLAFSAAAMFAACSPFLYQAIQPMSDVAAAAWSVAAVLCALKARRAPGWAAASGAALGMAVLVRPAETLVILPVALALPWKRRPLTLFAMAGLPFAIFDGLWNQTAFGAPYRTGYTGLFGEEFRLSYFAPRFLRYGWWTLVQFTPLVPLGWIGLAADRHVPRRDRALLIAWFASSLVFYCFWGSSANNWRFGRYLLPAAPALCIGFLLCLRDVARALANRGFDVRGRRVSSRAVVLAAAVCLVLFVERRVERRLRPLGGVHGQVVYPNACRRLTELAPDGKALVVGMEFSAAVRFYTRLTPVRWDFLSPGMFAALRARAAAKGYRILGVVFPHEGGRAAVAAPGEWRFLEKVGPASIWELPASTSP